jgi:hypothetical protein
MRKLPSDRDLLRKLERAALKKLEGKKPKTTRIGRPPSGECRTFRLQVHIRPELMHWLETTGMTHGVSVGVLVDALLAANVGVPADSITKAINRRVDKNVSTPL